MHVIYNGISLFLIWILAVFSGELAEMGRGAVHSAARGFQMFMSKGGLAKHLEMSHPSLPEVQYKLLFQNSSS